MRTIVSRYTFFALPAVHPPRWHCLYGRAVSIDELRCSTVRPAAARELSFSRREVCAALLLWVCSGNAAATAALSTPQTGNNLVCYRDESVQFLRPEEWTEDRLRRQRAVRNTALRMRPSTTLAKQADERLVLLAAFQSPLYPESDHLSVIVSEMEPGRGLERAETLATKFAQALQGRPAIATARVEKARDARHRDQGLYADFEVEVYGRAGWHRRNACSVTVRGNRLYTFTLQSRADAWQATRYLTCRDSFLAGIVSSTPMCPESN